jgi:phosphate transport system ATP-binding protein
MTGFFNVTASGDRDGKVGCLEEFAPTEQIFNAPNQQATLDYVSGRFG